MWKVEGIIFPGCGGDLNEWIEGVNELLTEEGIRDYGRIMPKSWTMVSLMMAYHEVLK